MPISVHRKHILLKWIYLPKCHFILQRGGVIFWQGAVHACVASGREQASKRYKMFTDIFMNNILLISQQPEQILALLFFLESTWAPSGPLTSSWGRPEEHGPWWAPDDSGNKTSEHNSPIQPCSVDNAHFSKCKKFDVVLSGESLLLLASHDARARWGSPQTLQWNSWWRTFLIEISGRILTVLGHKVLSFFPPVISQYYLLNYPGCEHASGYKLCFFWALRAPTVGSIIVLCQAENTARHCCAPRSCRWEFGD